MFRSGGEEEDAWLSGMQRTPKKLGKSLGASSVVPTGRFLLVSDECFQNTSGIAAIPAARLCFESRVEENDETRHRMSLPPSVVRTVRAERHVGSVSPPSGHLLVAVNLSTHSPR